MEIRATVRRVRLSATRTGHWAPLLDKRTRHGAPGRTHPAPVTWHPAQIQFLTVRE
jgi:hypothetical protein